MRNEQGLALPDFVCVGTYKAATTWLFALLDEHPGAFVPDVKEIHFFNERRGVDAYAEKGVAWYAGLFEPAPPGAVLGDVTPGYLACPRCAGRIHEVVPEARILVMLRDPVARFHSHYWYRHGMSAQMPTVDASIDGWSDTPDDLVAHGLYATHLQRYLDLFGADAVHVVLHDDVRRDPRGVWQEICGFIGIDPGFEPPSLGRETNAARSFRSRRLYRLNGIVARALYLSGRGDVLRRAIKRTGVPRLIDRLNRKPMDKPPLTPEQDARLRAIYRPEIERLSRLLDRDLSSWLGDPA